MHTTVKGSGYNTLLNEKQFRLVSDTKGLYIEHYSDGILKDMFWSKETLANMFQRKYPKGKLYFVKAESKEENGTEYFHYNEAYYLEKIEPMEKINTLLEEGILLVDIRIGMYTDGKLKGKRHDHGTGFRIKEDKLDLLFKKRTQLI